MLPEDALPRLCLALSLIDFETKLAKTACVTKASISPCCCGLLINSLTHAFWRPRELILRRENKRVTPARLGAIFLSPLHSGMQLLPEEKNFSIVRTAMEQGKNTKRFNKPELLVIADQEECFFATRSSFLTLKCSYDVAIDIRSRNYFGLGVSQQF